jgi:hypothetical protein
MLEKLTCLLVCAGMLLASAPLKAFAQTTAQPAGANIKDAPAKSRPDLTNAIGDLTTKSRFDPVTAWADLKKLEREGPNPTNAVKHDAAFTKNEKILVYSIVAGMVVLAVVLGLKTKKGGHTFCDIDPSDPDCLLP